MVNDITGTTYLNGKCCFSVWAPEKRSMVLHLVYPQEQLIDMQPDGQGYFKTEIEGMAVGARYFFKPEGGNDYPDPASRFQPMGVHGPSEVIDQGAYKWQDANWKGKPFNELILYELHVGTFTKEGTFDAIIPRLDDMASVGINAIEIMPVSQFPGERNWGYDGTYPYAVQNSYGGPEGFKKLIDACHQKGIAVFLDVVYNHLGPEGNYLSQFGPYFTNKYHAPWGDAINFDSDWSDGVREYFSNNALYWFHDYHIDGLRLDAIHAIYDMGAVNFWALLHGKVKRLEQETGRSLYLVAESDLNDPRVIRETSVGGYAFDAQWLDDFHHALYVLLDKKGLAQYEDFGSIEQLAKAYKDGYVHSGEYVKFRKRKFGTSSAGISGDRFVAFIQNHDQVGNRVRGERLCMLIDFERQKLAAAAILLSPYVPLLFMGEEYADEHPFFYFVSHSEEQLIQAVREGRKKEFERYKWNAEPPDPQSKDTFDNSKLHWEQRNTGKHRVMLDWYTALIALRRNNAILQNFIKNDITVNITGRASLLLHRKNSDGLEHILIAINFSEENVPFILPDYSDTWKKVLDSKETKWLNPEVKIQDKETLPFNANSGEKIILAPLSVSVYSGRIY